MYKYVHNVLHLQCRQIKTHPTSIDLRFDLGICKNIKTGMEITLKNHPSALRPSINRRLWRLDQNPSHRKRKELSTLEKNNNGSGNR